MDENRDESKISQEHKDSEAKFPQFSCACCGNCCQNWPNIPLFPEEADLLENEGELVPLCLRPEVFHAEHRSYRIGGVGATSSRGG